MKMPCVPSPIGAEFTRFFFPSVLVMGNRARLVLDELSTSEPQPQAST